MTRRGWCRGWLVAAGLVPIVAAPSAVGAAGEATGQETAGHQAAGHQAAGDEAAGQAQAGQDVFLLTGHYQLRLEDKVAEGAKIYAIPAGVPRMIAVAPGLKQPLLVTAGAKTVEGIDPRRLTEEDGDALRLAPAPAGAPAGATAKLAVDGTKLRANVGGTRVSIEMREPLVGTMTPEQMLAHMPEYRRNFMAYKPRTGDLRLLATVDQPTEVQIFFGTWCPHCEKYVPRLLRVIDELKNPNIALKLHGLPVRVDEDPLARQLKITAVPIGLVRSGDQPAGRLEGTNWERPEAGLAALLFGGGS